MGKSVNKLDIFDKLYIIVGTPWLFLMIFTSRMYTGIKTALLAVLLIIALMEISHKRLFINKQQLGFSFFFVFYAIFSLLYGIVLGYEFEFAKDFGLIQYYMITPLCIIVFSTVFSAKYQRAEYIWEVIKYLTLVLALIDVLRVVLFMIGIDPPYLSFIMMASDNFQTVLTLRVSNEPSLMFLAPIFVFLLINPNTTNKKDRIIYLTIVIFSIIYGILSGRKILEISIMLSAFFSYLFVNGKFSFKRFSVKKVLRLLIISILIVVIFSALFEKLSVIMGIDNILDLAYNTLVEELKFGDHGADGANKRLENSSLLFNLWIKSPIWGNGLNAYSELSLANTVTKWSYEVVYVAWIAQTGIIGAYLLYLPSVYIIKKLSFTGRKFLDNRYFALAFGFASFLFCGSSNPVVYLVWPWSIVLTFCNVKLYNSVSNATLKYRK